MQLTKFEVSVGTTINLGDFQSVKAEVRIGADLDPREDDNEAFNTLRKKAQSCLISLLNDNHPNTARSMLGGGAPAQAQLAAPAPQNGAETAEEKVKRTRRTKEQIAADEAAKAAASRVEQAAAQLGEPSPDLTGAGGDDSDDMAALLGDAIPDHPPVTQAEAKKAAGELLQKLGGASLKKLLNEFGADSFPTLDAAKYGAFVAKVKAQVATA
jgi:hypothetical protein